MSEQQRREKPAAIPHWLSPDSDVLEITDGDGVYVYDSNGNEYLDFISQLYCVNAGHSNQSIVEAMTDQLERIQYVSAAKYNDTRNRLAGEIASVAPQPLSEVFFSVSGSEANEAAVQIAREYTGKSKILTRWQSYHGGTYGAGGLTGDPATRATIEKYAAVTGTGKFLPPLEYQSPFNADSPEELADLAADHLEFVIQNEGPDSVAAVLMEPVAGTSGAYTAPPGYFEQVREICDTYDVLLISDEVITGFGRCGDWFGIQTEGVVPDLLTFAKASTGAYAPLAGVVTRDDIAGYLREEGIKVGQTFAGHPVACAAGIAALEEYRTGLIENVQDLAPYFEEQLSELADRHAPVGDVRGRGFFWGVEFTDPETGEPYLHPWFEEGENPVDAVIEEAQDRGVLIGGGRPTVQVCISPPLSIDRSGIDEGVGILDDAIEAVFG